ncbi:MAG: hypothetical protein GF330_00510 [Candidatus Eisenbacteria bacterium]|nr:hypothetical protein [Candidatus Eisenbacteria bacterium]
MQQRQATTALPLLLVALLCTATTPPAAQATAPDDAGGRAYEFLRMPAEPEGRSLASAHLAVVGGAGAMAWNPAGLARAPEPALILAHATWMAETSWEWGALALPLHEGRGGLGVCVGALRVGSLEQYDSEGQPLGSFSPLLTCGSLGYATALGDHLRAGILLEGVLERSGVDTERSAWAGGVGLQWESRRLAVGVSALHLAPESEIEETRFPLPMTVRAGATWAVGHTLRVHGAVEYVAESAPRLLAGWAWQPVRGLRALTGLLHDPAHREEAWRPTCGLACTVGRVGVTYGYQPAAWLDASHQLALSFGGPAPF